jgi:hypothetical protein
VTTDPDPTVRVLGLDATLRLVSPSTGAPGGGPLPALGRVPAAGLVAPPADALGAVAAGHPGLPLAVDFDYSAGVGLDDRVTALLATVAHDQHASGVPAVLTLVDPVTLDEQCAAAAYAVAGGVTLIVSDQPLAVERAVRVTTALRAHESIAEPAAR